MQVRKPKIYYVAKLSCFHFLAELLAATAVVQCTNIEGGKYYFPPGFLIHREKQ